MFARLFRQSGIESLCGRDARVGEAFDRAFDAMRAVGLRGEYVYRTALTHKVLMGTHSLSTASMLTEFRAGGSKADLVILNGTATVYEIKSERDSLSRLANQIENYKRVFAKVYVIGGENHVRPLVEVTSPDVGVLCLSRRHQISTVREAEDRPDRICPLTVFESLRAAEACMIVKMLGFAIPDVPNTRLHAELRELFRAVQPTGLHMAMVDTLKRTRTLAPLGGLVDRLPKSLQAAALSVPLRKGDHDRLVKATHTPLTAAMAWV